MNTPVITPRSAQRLLPLALMARRVGVPSSKLKRVISSTGIVPDAVAPTCNGVSVLFSIGRAEELKTAVSNFTK